MPPQILVVDDERRICEFLTALLSKSGYDVHTCESGQAAFDALGQRHYDLLITDLVMPGADGTEVVRAAKRINPDMPCIMVTGYATIDAATQAMKAGADDHIIKPFDVNQLRQLVKRHLERTVRTANCEQMLSDLRVADAECKTRRSDAAAHATRLLADTRHTMEHLSAQLAGLRAKAEAAQAAADRLDFGDVTGAVAKAITQELGWPSAAVFVRTGEKSLQFSLAAKHNWPPAADVEAPGVVDLVAECAQSKKVRAERQLLPGLTLAVAPVVDNSAVAAAVCVAAPDGAARTDDRNLSLLQVVVDSIAQPLLETRRLQSAQRECWRMAERLVATLEGRSEFRKNHAQRVAEYAALLARTLGLSEAEIQAIRRGALLQNIGEITMAPSILDKPTELSDSEFEMMRRHPEAGEKIADEIDAFRNYKKAIRHHHERWDGRGYPDGLQGDRTPLDARIISLSDAFDAMTSDRPYRKARPSDYAIGEIRQQAGMQFDPDLAKACEEAFKNLRKREQGEGGAQPANN